MERVAIGTLACDIITPTDFYRLCQTWLASDHFHHVVTLNAEMVVQAQTDPIFRAAARAATIRVPEGGPLWANQYLHASAPLVPSLLAFARHESPRVTGVDMVPRLVELAHRRGQGIYLVGGSLEQVQKTAALFRDRHPGIRLHTSPPHAFDSRGPEKLLADIRAKQPALLLVAYGAPKQTIWIEEHRNRLPSVRLAVGVGGAFALIGQTIPRAPGIVRRHNLEWGWRLLQEPGRLPRIWRATVQFPLLVRQQKRKSER